MLSDLALSVGSLLLKDIVDSSPKAFDQIVHDILVETPLFTLLDGVKLNDNAQFVESVLDYRE